MVSLVEHKQCTGCMACRQACPKQCIEEKEDYFGNIYPKIDYNKCIGCEKCRAVCPELHKDDMKFFRIKQANAVWSIDHKTRSSSASGGAASEMYKEALELGYWICGVQYMEGFHVIHTLSKDVESIRKYRQSKYVYSEVGRIYKEIEEKLKKKEKVLFISLPCKVAGLKKYLGKEYPLLVTVDIVCHGVPPYRQLINHMKQVGKEAQRLKFRDENEFLFETSLNTGKVIYKKYGRQDTYLAAFLEGLNYRQSCYQCTYAKAERISDITICDYWGLGTEVPFEHPYTGSVSAVLINSDKGELFFDKCKGKLFVEERPVIEAIKGNAQLNYPTPMHLQRKRFEKLYQKIGFEKAVKEILREKIKKDRNYYLKFKLRKTLRKMAGMIIPKYRS